MFSIKDKKTNHFYIPFPCENYDSAKRIYEMTKADKNNIVAKYPNDFGVYHVGSFNFETGLLKSVEPTELIDEGVIE